MKEHYSSKSSLFLIELIITTFFFALSSMVGIRLFMTAHQLDEKSQQITVSTKIVADLSESFYMEAGDEVLDGVSAENDETLDGVSAGNDEASQCKYYDAKGQEVSKDTAVYEGILSITDRDLDAGLTHATVEVKTLEGESVCSQKLSAFTGKGGLHA